MGAYRLSVKRRGAYTKVDVVVQGLSIIDYRAHGQAAGWLAVAASAWRCIRGGSTKLQGWSTELRGTHTEPGNVLIAESVVGVLRARHDA